VNGNVVGRDGDSYGIEGGMAKMVLVFIRGGTSVIQKYKDHTSI
jgi:hypothetical protein